MNTRGLKLLRLGGVSKGWLRRLNHILGLVLLACFPAGAQLPVTINPGGIVNSASYASPPLAPGGIASLFGTLPIATPGTAQTLPLPTTLDGVSVSFGNGLEAPLFYASSGQVNFEVPTQLAGMSQASVTLIVSGQSSAAQTVSLAPYSPGLFSINGQGSGQGAILNTANQLVNTSNPAMAGSTVIQIFATGLGDGTTAPSVTIGGVAATVTFSGLAPGLMGVNQVNAMVPAGAPAGNAVPVVVSIGGLNSNTVTIAVSGSPNPVPSISSLSPAFGAVGSASQQVTINGANFVAGSTVTFNGAAQTAMFNNSGQLTFTLTGAELASSGSFPVVVTNPSPGSGSSNAVGFIAGPGFNSGSSDSVGWQNFARDAQHTALSLNQSQPLNKIHWQTPVDLDPQFVSGELLIHYGSPLVTPANTVIVPVKTGATEGFRVEAHRGTDGTLIWSQTSDYVLPLHDWTPEFSPAITPGLTLYFPGAGGTVYSRANPDAASGTQSQLAFYGMTNYQANPAAYNSGVMINTPIIADPGGNIYFGFVVIGNTPLGLQSGIARISASGQGTSISVTAASGDGTMTEVVQNCAPALNWNLGMLYVAVSNGSAGYLLELNSTTLQPVARVVLTDPVSGQAAMLDDDGSATPFVGPDGDVYYGVLENPLGENHYRGWLLHFNSGLSQKKTTGDFGWDDTPSLVPGFMAPGYTGTSAYLIMTKYNDYANAGGTGLNKIAVLDPNATETDSATRATVMKEVLTITGPTPSTTEPGVKEWCINSAAVDPSTSSIFAGSEDGKLYRWNLVTNTFSQSIVLTPGLGEAYTPTIIGVDGTVYAINNATLFAVGQ
jgi:uncharacterized protein (TIGR03437 family)